MRNKTAISFGGVPHFLPKPQLPGFDINLMLKVLSSGLTIAFLAGVESLLSATVVDGMSGDNHNSNAELVGEGIANIMSMLFAGVPATGAIARTATNFRARAYSPMAGIMQSVFLLLFMLLLSPAAKYIPLACLSAVLVLIGWNMLNLDKIYKLLNLWKCDTKNCFLAQKLQNLTQRSVCNKHTPGGIAIWAKPQ